MFWNTLVCSGKFNNELAQLLTVISGEAREYAFKKRVTEKTASLWQVWATHFDSFTIKHRNEKKAWMRFKKSFLWMPGELVKGPHPSMRASDPGDAFDEETCWFHRCVQHEDGTVEPSCPWYHYVGAVVQHVITGVADGRYDPLYIDQYPGTDEDGLTKTTFLRDQIKWALWHLQTFISFNGDSEAWMPAWWAWVNTKRGPRWQAKTGKLKRLAQENPDLYCQITNGFVHETDPSSEEEESWVPGDLFEPIPGFPYVEHEPEEMDKVAHENTIVEATASSDEESEGDEEEEMDIW
mmetsp:Transcript_21850/g.53544  ORF Transcript_21850/g.53544 Transcript_21850/m.53544 type:complete len:295 (-) Transcript_21850:1130-2014(-)